MFTPFGQLSPVIRTLMIINAAIFVFGILIGSNANILFSLFSLSPNIIFDFTPESLYGKPWSVFTYMFLHGSFFHLFANMFFGLWMFGDSVARDLGDKHFLKLFLLSGLFAGVLSALVYNFFGVNVAVIGASGATYAVMYVFCKNNPHATVYVMFVFPMRVKTLFIVLLVIEGLGTIKNILPAFQSDGIAHLTHLAGLLGGFLYLKFFYSGYRSGSVFRGTEESSFSNITDKLRKSFSGNDTKSKEYDTFSPHDSNEMLDSILKKVSEYGITALSEKEKIFLEKVSEQRRRQQGGNIHRMDDYK